MDRYLEKIISFRRDLHRIPEVGLDLPLTRKYITDALRQMGYTPRQVAGGVVVDIGNPPYLALRADMDALPIREENDAPYRSTRDGYMHACGHDGHMAVLLGVALYLRDHPPQRGVRLIFQPGEEGFHGARYMVNAGVLEGVSFILGAHVGYLGWDAEPGTVIVREGPFMAAADTFKVVFKGKGTHGSTPHTGRDPIAMMGHFITSIYTAKSRLINQSHPTVISVGKAWGGTTHNIIPPQAEVEGTIRSFSEEDRKALKGLVEDVARVSASLFGGKAEVEFEDGYPPLINDREGVKRLINLTQSLGIKVKTDIDPIMGAEDFAYYLGVVPGVFFFVDTSDPERGIVYPNHNPKFDINEKMLSVPFRIFIGAVENWEV